MHFFKKVVKSVTGYGVKKSAIIEDADRIQVDSSPLHCPICLSVFGSSTVVLPCGHTFCLACIDRLIKTSVHCDRKGATPIECALCRSRSLSNEGFVRNFAIEALLETLEQAQYPPSENEVIAEQNLLIQRLRKKATEAEDARDEMRKQLEKERQNNRPIYALLIFLGACVAGRALLLVFSGS
ncbi:Protein F08G12.5 [Aphelenchoides avenae]|nr:Protein F08G12.5 [Aphelenchus avenae]